MAKPLTALSASLLAAIMLAGCASLPFEDESLNSATGPRTLEARRLEPGIVRNSSPAQQAIGVTGVGVPVVAGMPAPIAAEVLRASFR